MKFLCALYVSIIFIVTRSNWSPWPSVSKVNSPIDSSRPQATLLQQIFLISFLNYIINPLDPYDFLSHLSFIFHYLYLVHAAVLWKFFTYFNEKIVHLTVFQCFLGASKMWSLAPPTASFICFQIIYLGKFFFCKFIYLFVKKAFLVLFVLPNYFRPN